MLVIVKEKVLEMTRDIVCATLSNPSIKITDIKIIPELAEAVFQKLKEINENN